MTYSLLLSLVVSFLYGFHYCFSGLIQTLCYQWGEINKEVL